MLQAMREGAGFTFIKIILFTLLGLAMIGLAVMDLGGFFRGSLGRGEIARVGDVQLSISTFDRIYRNQLQQSRLDAETARLVKFPLNVLQQEISRLAILQAAYESGLRISETFIANNLTDQLDDMGIPAEERAAFFENYLRNTGMSEAMMVQSIQQDTLTMLLMDPVEQTAKLPYKIAKQIYAFEKEQRIGHLVSIKMEQVDNVPEFSEEEKRAYYEANIVNYTVPESRDIAYAVITRDLAMKGEAVSDEQIKSYYESNLELYTTPAQRSFAHVIVQDKEQAQQLTALAMEGASLKEAAAEALGDDADYDFIPEDWYAQETLLPELVDAVYANGKEKQEVPFITGPIETPLGFHVVSVTDEKPAETRPLDKDLKAEIKEHLKTDIALERVYALGEQLDDMVAGGASLTEAAKDLGIPVKEVSGLTTSGKTVDNKALLDDVPMAQEVMNYAFQMQTGEVSPLFDTEDGDLMAVGVKNITPDSPKPYEEVASPIEKDLEMEYRIAQVQEKSAEIIKRLNESDQSLHALATVYNLPYQKTRALTRQAAQNDNGSGDISSQARQLLFTLSPDNPVSTMTEDNGITIVALGDIIPVKNIPDTNDETIAAIREGMAQIYAGDVVNQFVLYWRDKLGVSVNEKLLTNQYLKAAEE